MFTDVTDTNATSTAGYPVRLNDLAPAFDIRAAECIPQVYPESHRCNPAHPFRDKDTGMLEKIIDSSIAVGTAGKVTDLSQTYETTFDATAFNKAVDEALINTGLNENRRRLIEMIDTYDREVQQARANATEMADDISESRNRPDRVEVDIRPTIDGLAEYFRGDIDFTDLVTLEIADHVEVPGVSLPNRSILPCDAMRCVADAEQALAKLRYDIAAHHEQLEVLAQPDPAVVTVRCDDSRHSGYLLALECPEQIVAAPGERARLDIRATILARDFESLLPAFDLRDDRLRIAIDETAFTLTNRTDEYVTVTAHTVYYNSKAHTSSQAIDIPPGMTVSSSVDELLSPEIVIESTYHGMTPDKAARASFRFGLAVRYRVSSMIEEQTLHSVESYNVGCVIEDQIRPGACRHESVADADTPAGKQDGRLRIPH